jgi:hypothetical protein
MVGSFLYTLPLTLLTRLTMNFTWSWYNCLEPGSL